MAVPFIPDDGSEVFSFNCGAPAFILTQSAMENDIGPRLVALVKASSMTICEDIDQRFIAKEL